MNAVERVWYGFRRVVGRALGTMTQKRAGYFYAYRRTVAEWISLALSSFPTRVPVEPIDLGSVPGRIPGAEVHQVIPAESGGPPRVRSVRAQSVTAIPGGVVFGNRGWYGTDRTNVVVAPSQTLWPWPVADRRRLVGALRDAREIALPGTTVNLLHPGFANYAHFMLQLVPRLSCVRRVVDLGDVDRVLVPDSAPKYCLEVLARVGVETDQLFPVPADPPRVYVCERLVTATMLDTSEVGPQWAADAVRVPYAAEMATRGNRRLYLAREAGFSRRILNEDAVVSLLEARGFDAVSMAAMTVAEQAALIARAECIVGLHGAALANWVFAHPGTRVVELRPANLAHSMYGWLAGRLGLPYGVAVGTEPCPPGRLRRFLIDSDTTVDVAALTRLLDAALVA